MRNYCLARGSTKLDSLCVCSQQSVSKVNSDWLWSKHIFIQIGSFYRSEWNNCPPEQEMRLFMWVEVVRPGVQWCVFPRLSIKCTGGTVGGSYWDENPAAVIPHLLRSRCANNTPARIRKETAGSLKAPAEVQTHSAHAHKNWAWTWREKKGACSEKAEDEVFFFFTCSPGYKGLVWTEYQHCPLLLD